MSYQNDQMSRFNPDGPSLYDSRPSSNEVEYKKCSMCGEYTNVADMMYNDFCLVCFEENVSED